MIAGAFFVTPHAVRRYIERIDSRCDYGEARRRLIAMGELAHHVRPMSGGAELWRVGRPHRLRLIVGRDHAGAPQIVSVLAAHDGAARC